MTIETAAIVLKLDSFCWREYGLTAESSRNLTDPSSPLSSAGPPTTRQCHP
jgi:hypothetical protein